jgi:hypothetical protein
MSALQYEKVSVGDEKDYGVAIIYTMPFTHEDFNQMFINNEKNIKNILGDLGLEVETQTNTKNFTITKEGFKRIFETEFERSVKMTIFVRNFITGNFVIFKRIMAFSNDDNINCTVDFKYINNEYVDFEKEDYNPALSAMLSYFENKFDNIDDTKFWDDELFEFKRHICQAMCI